MRRRGTIEKKMHLRDCSWTVYNQYNAERFGNIHSMLCMDQNLETGFPIDLGRDRINRSCLLIYLVDIFGGSVIFLIGIFSL